MEEIKKTLITFVFESVFTTAVGRSNNKGRGGNRIGRIEGEMAQKKLGGGRNRRKSREEGEIGSESREKGDLLPCSSSLTKGPSCWNAILLANYAANGLI